MQSIQTPYMYEGYEVGKGVSNPSYHLNFGLNSRSHSNFGESEIPFLVVVCKLIHIMSENYTN